ncbi:START domain-containing protein [Trichostrongylus colubriformis]|uniref:START domain-containing protein n=1 Tax=Trichostrongylus colubriformis TaxID=6319 RepID=A0AAN8F6F4_TRICO
MGSTEQDLVLPSSGTLLKWTNYINGWRERFFEIKHGQLLYYANKGDQGSGCRGSISLKKLEVSLHEFNECEFSVAVGDVVWYLRAENPHSRTYWVKALTRDSNDSDYSSNTTKTHSRNTSLSSLTLGKKSEDQNTMVTRIAELEAYRTMYREQMSSIRRELQQMGVPQAKILSINATHVAMLDNINHIIQLAKNESRPSTSQNSWIPNTPVSPCTPSPLPAVDDGEAPSRETTLRQDTAPHSLNDVTSDCGDEWHDADEHSSLSLDSAEEAIERRTPPGVGAVPEVVSAPQEMETIEEKSERTLLFGDYDSITIPKDHIYYDLVDHLAKEQLRYALAGVEDNVWTLFAEDGAMKMYTREETADGGLPVDPLKAVHHVQGVSALEFMHYFFDEKYKMEWDHTLNGMQVVERISHDTLVILQKHKTVWPAASRESLFVSHIRRVDELKNSDALDLYIVCNKDVTRADVPVSSGIRVGLTVSMICETVVKNGKTLNELSRDDVSCRVIYVSQVHPGGWVPTAALRQVYKREYPKFLRTFTSYVVNNVKNKPLSFVSVMNYYGKEVLIPITTRREITVSVAIVIVVADLSNKEQYQLAQDTVSCYATYHRYPLHFVNVADNSTLTEVCPQKDFMFQRHCVVAHMMSSWQEEWLLFVDADMAIINPNHLIEEYIPSDPAIHVVFYNRIFNHEVMAGSYLIRRSNYSYKFLMHWSSYEFKLPQSFHGSDNGAIHSAIVSYELPARESARNTCEQFWMAAKDYDTLSIYEVCMQMILSSDQLKHILILPKGSLSWARDGWLTNSVWGNRDFILHGWQKRRKDRMRFARWHSPLVDTTWNSALCEGSNAYFNWRYKDSFINKNEEIQRKLDVTIRRVAADFDSIKERI